MVSCFLSLAADGSWEPGWPIAGENLMTLLREGLKNVIWNIWNQKCCKKIWISYHVQWLILHLRYPCSSLCTIIFHRVCGVSISVYPSWLKAQPSVRRISPICFKLHCHWRWWHQHIFMQLGCRSQRSWLNHVEPRNEAWKRLAKSLFERINGWRSRGKTNYQNWNWWTLIMDDNGLWYLFDKVPKSLSTNIRRSFA